MNFGIFWFFFLIKHPFLGIPVDARNARNARNAKNASAADACAADSACGTLCGAEGGVSRLGTAAVI